jgi:hypothetical protein
LHSGIYYQYRPLPSRADQHRVVGIHPNKLLGVIGDHDDFPVERIRLSGDKLVLGSCSHDRTVKFWSLEGLLEVSAV